MIRAVPAIVAGVYTDPPPELADRLENAAALVRTVIDHALSDQPARHCNGALWILRLAAIDVLRVHAEAGRLSYMEAADQLAQCFDEVPRAMARAECEALETRARA